MCCMPHTYTSKKIGVLPYVASSRHSNIFLTKSIILLFITCTRYDVGFSFKEKEENTILPHIMCIRCDQHIKFYVASYRWPLEMYLKLMSPYENTTYV